MKHGELDSGTLRAYLDGELNTERASAVEQHMENCPACREEAGNLGVRAARAREGLDRLPQFPEAGGAAAGWAAFQQKREDAMETEPLRWGPIRWDRCGWGPWKTLSLVGGSFAVIALVVALTVTPVRLWAENNLLAIFRVEHFTALELNPASLSRVQSDPLLNQTISRVFSDDVVVTQKPQKPSFAADAAAATKLAGFPVKLLAGETPEGILVTGGVGMQMTLNRDHLQSILDEAGRSDLQIPASVDGATIGVRIPAGIMAFYGNCGDAASRLLDQASSVSSDSSGQKPDDTCVMLRELPSPIVSAPQQMDPAQIVEVALQFLGMSANDAANFTQTVDWTSTLVLPVVRGESSYEQVYVNGNEGALVRSQNPRESKSKHFNLMWVDNGMVFALDGIGDDVTAVNLGSQLE